jgi:hypothetical protein
VNAFPEEVMRIVRSFLLLALALPLTACSDRTDPTGMAAQTDLPALAAIAESQGAMVDRYQTGLAVYWWDPETELLAAHIFRDPYAACAAPGVPVEFYPTSVKDVISSRDSEGADLVRTLTQTKEISIKVWHSPNGMFTIALRCSEPIAEGIGHVISTDNDANVYQSDRMHANVYGFMAQGTLYGPDGQPYHYNSIMRTKWQPNSGDPDWREHEVLKINLVPMGQ